MKDCISLEHFVLLLQNDAGARAWPLTAESEAALRAAFLASRRLVPSELVEAQQRHGLYIPKSMRQQAEEEGGEQEKDELGEERST